MKRERVCVDRISCMSCIARSPQQRHCGIEIHADFYVSAMYSSTMSLPSASVFSIAHSSTLCAGLRSAQTCAPSEQEVYFYRGLVSRQLVMKAGLEYKRQMMLRKQQMGQELGEEIHEKMRSAMSEFKRCLEEFALKHREEIRHDPEFRAHFHDMCQHAGVDPLASNKSSVNSFLSFSGWSFTTFYYALGVSVVEACMATRAENGGLIELNKLTRLVQRRRGSAVDPVSADDVLQAVGKLQALDNSFTVIPDPKKVKSKKGVTFFVNSVPRELDMNLHDVLGLAKDTGCFTLEQLAEQPSWTHRRAELALEAMIKDGTCMIDDGSPDGVRLFWIPSSATALEY